MPPEEQPSSPGPGDGSDEDRPSSPKHVFDDDVEMKPISGNLSNPQDADASISAIPTAEYGQTTPNQANGQDAESKQQSESSAPPPAHTEPPSHEAPADQPERLLEPSQDDQDSQPRAPILFDTMLHKPSSSPGLVTAWMSHVSNNGPDAMGAIVSLVISAARPVPFSREQLVTSEMIIANEPQESVKDLCQVLAVDAPEKVVVLAKDTPSRRVRRTYEDFWRRIAAEAPDIVLYHTDCFETLIPWLESMSSSPIRALRVSASLAAYRLVDGFIEVGTQLRKHLATVQRQLNTEKRRSGITQRDDMVSGARKRAAQGKGKKKELSAKGKELANKVDELTAKNSELTELCDRVYRSIFIGRYRDISAEVRSMSLSALGGWIMMFPDQFLDDTHNKYIGWLLSDKDAVVRKTSVEVLHRMLKKKEYFANFETFLQRFCDRIIEMAFDKDDAVAANAIRLLNFLLPHNTNDKLLRPAQCESICDIALEDHHTDVRRAAGEFLTTMVTMDIDDVPSSASKRSRAQRKRSSKRTSTGPFNTLLREIPPVDRAQEDIRELLFALVRKEDGEVDAALAVDAVWDYLPSLRCWQAFEELLLEDQPPDKEGEDGEALSDSEKSVLCEMLLACVVEASGNGDPMRARIVEKGEYSDPETPGTLLSKQFLPLLPKLLNQYQSDPKTIRALVQLPRYFTMKTFEQQGQDGHFSAVLERIIGVLMKHTGSEEISAVCGETLRTFLSDQNPLKKATCTSLQLCCQRVSKDLALQVRTDLAKAAPDNVAALVSQLRILTELVDSDSSTYEIVKEVLEFQTRKGDLSGLNDLVTIDASRSACAFAVWSLSKIRSRLTTTGSSETPHEKVLELEEVQEYRKQAADVVDVLQSICACDSVPLAVRLLCSRCVLIILTLCRGIEKNTSMMILRKRTESDNASSAAPDLDLLSLQEKVPQLVDMIWSVVAALVEHELKLSSLKESGRNRGNAALPEREVRDFFASLVQASLQSALSRQISHFPLFGVLLKPSKETKTESNEYTSFRVCRDYLQQRQVRGNALSRDVVCALHEVLKMQCAKKEKQSIIRELADICVSFRYRRELKSKESVELLQALFKYCAEALDSNGFAGKLFVLSSSSFALIPHFSQDDAKGMMESMKTIDDHRNKYAESLDDELTDLFDHFHSSLEAVADGRFSELPSIMKASDRPGSKGRPRSKRRRRAASPRSHTPPPEPSNVRKSSRQKARVDYTRMENYSSDDDEDGDDEREFEQESENADETATTAADVARNMMEYQNSPVAVRKRADREIPESNLNPAKRRRRSNNSSNGKETSTKLQTQPSSGTDSLVRNSTPKAIAIAKTNSQDAGDQNGAPVDESEVFDEQVSDHNLKKAEPTRKADLEKDNRDGEDNEAIAAREKSNMTRRSGKKDGLRARSHTAGKSRDGRSSSSPGSLADGDGQELQDVSQEITPQPRNEQPQQATKYATRRSKRKSTSSEQSSGRALEGTSDKNPEESAGDEEPEEQSRPSRTTRRSRGLKQGALSPDHGSSSQKSDVANEYSHRKTPGKENKKAAVSKANGQVKPPSRQGLIRRRKVRRW